MSDQGERTWQPLIIAGLPRSGTTLLATFLASQPRCTFVTDYISAFVDASDRLGITWNTRLDRSRRRIALAIVRDQLLRFRHPVLAKVDEFETIADLHHIVLSELARPEDLVVGHKMLLSSDALRSALDETELRIAILYRDPRDAALSYFYRTGGGVDAYLAEWRSILRLVERVRSPRLFALRYEDLIATPTTALSPLFEALGLPLQTAHVSLAFARGPAGTISWTGNSSAPVAPRVPFDRSVMGRWRSDSNERISRYAAWTCRYEMRRFGYDLGPRISVQEAAGWELRRRIYQALRRADQAYHAVRTPLLDLVPLT